MTDIQFSTLQSSIDELKRIATLGSKDTLSLEEVSEVYGLKKSYLYSLVHTKRIPHYKAGGGRLTFFKKKEVEAFLTAQRVGTYEEAEASAAKYEITKTMEGGVKWKEA